MYPPNLNVPLPDPTSLAPQQTLQGPDKMQQAMSLIAPMLALGTALGGSPRSGAAFLHGAHSTLQRQEQEKRVKEHQQQQAAVQQQQIQATEAYRQQQMEAQRQQQITQFIAGTQKSLEGVTDRDQYEQTIGFAEALGQQQYGLRPNTLRGLVPYRAPNAKKNLYDAVDKYLKNPANKLAIESGQAMQSAIQVDTDGDGVPDKPVPFAEAVRESGYPIFLDDTGKPIQVEKPIKPENVEPFDLAYRGLVDRWKTEKGRDPSDAEKGQLAVAAQRSLDKPPAAPTGDLPPRAQSQVNSIATAFRSEPIVKRANTIAEAVSFVNSLDPKSSNPADDQALIYAFAKAMDPESVVREGEYATVQKYAQSWVSTFGFNAERVVSNSEFLTPQARANLKATILKKYGAVKAQYDNARRGFSRQIGAVTGGKADPEDYLMDYAGAFPNAQTGAPARPEGHAQTPYSLGQVVSVKGQKVRVTKLNPDGTYEGEVVR